MLLNNVINLPVLGGLPIPGIPPRNQETPPEQTGGNAGSGGTAEPEPHDRGGTGGGTGNVPPSNAGPAPVRETTEAYRPAATEAEAGVFDEDWARNMALETQAKERVSRMIKSLATPKASEILALMRRDDAPRSDLKSVIAAYRDSETPETAASAVPMKAQ